MVHEFICNCNKIKYAIYDEINTIKYEYNDTITCDLTVVVFLMGSHFAIFLFIENSYKKPLLLDNNN